MSQIWSKQLWFSPLCLVFLHIYLFWSNIESLLRISVGSCDLLFFFLLAPPTADKLRRYLKPGSLQGLSVQWDICLPDITMTFMLSCCLFTMVHMVRNSEGGNQPAVCSWDSASLESILHRWELPVSLQITVWPQDHWLTARHQDRHLSDVGRRAAAIFDAVSSES